MRHWYQHFAHGDAAMLEGVAIVTDVIVVVVRVGEEVALASEDVGRAQVHLRQENLLWVFHLEDFFRVVFQVLAVLVAQVGVHLTVAQNADGFFDIGRAVVGGDDHVAALFRDEAHHVEEAGVLKPRVHQRAVGFLIVGQFADDFHLRAGVGKHIHEVVNNDIQLVRHQVGHLLIEFLARLQVQHLIIRIFDVLAEALQLFAEKFALKLVLRAFVLLIDPPFGVAAADFEGHQSGEEGISGVLRGRGQNAVINVVSLHAEMVLNERLNGLPLVVAQVVYHDEKQRFVAIVEAWNNFVAHHGMRHHRFLRATLNPVDVVPLDVARELRVGLLFLVGEDGFDALVCGFLQFQLPAYQVLIQINPLVEVEVVVEVHADFAELLLIAHRRFLVAEFLVFEVAFQRKQNLVRVHGLDEIIRYVRADCILHDAFLLALGDHHYGEIGIFALDDFECLDARNARHLLVQENNVEMALAHEVDGVGAVVGRNDLIAFLFQKHDMGLEEINLVIGPKDGGFVHGLKVLWSKRKSRDFVLSKNKKCTTFAANFQRQMTSSNKKKIFNDPIYGFVSIPDELHFDIIEHPYFQRLRRIKQVSMTNLVYPGANHTRFAHSLGAMHLMRRAIQLLRGKGYDITDEELEAASLAILLHDSGHGPFSHTLENSIVQGVSHEELSLMVMQKFNEIHGGRLDLAIKLFKGEYEKGFLSKLISSQLDVDRIDYLKRDSFFSGVAEGSVNAERLLEMMEVVGNELAIEAKGIYSVESFLVARRIMYWQVYMHKAVLSAEYTLMKVLKRAKMLSAERDLFATPSLSFFLKNQHPFADGHDPDFVLDKFCQLDDYDVMTAVKVWRDDEDRVLSELCRRLTDRHLFKIEMQDSEFDPNYFEDIRNKIAKYYGWTLEEADFALLQGVSSNHAYHPKKPAINILYKDGTMKDISEASDQLNISVLSQPVVKHFICYPKELGR